MKKSLPLPDKSYRGRFAPSPTGPLHFGSLIAAVGSYLDAKYHGGTWLIRMEDLDLPRCVSGVADDILRTLNAFGLHSDEPIIYQSTRTDAYEEALQYLKDCGAAYPCACTRKEIADSALHGIEGNVYPGTCRNGIAVGRKARSWRVRTDDRFLAFDDIIQGHVTQALERDIGDFVVKRADRLFAYQLAVVVDDAFQKITHVVRGCDMLASTARQIYLQQLLGLRTPDYMHLPIAVNAHGEKLSKQTLAPAITCNDIGSTLVRVLSFLRQRPPSDLQYSRPEEILHWATENWYPSRLKGCRQIQANPD